jgi:hypothetical protein
VVADTGFQGFARTGKNRHVRTTVTVVVTGAAYLVLFSKNTNKSICLHSPLGIRVVWIVCIPVIWFNKRLPTHGERQGNDRFESGVVNMKLFVLEHVEAVSIGLQDVKVLGKITILP